MKYQTDIADLLRRYAVSAGECVEWSGYKNQDGYGRAYITLMDGSRKLMAVHRLAYELHNGPIPKGKDVMHTCDNRPCIHGPHLVPGTEADNIHDMIAKGRAWFQKFPQAPPPAPPQPSQRAPDRLELPGQVWTRATSQES